MMCPQTESKTCLVLIRRRSDRTGDSARVRESQRRPKRGFGSPFAVETAPNASGPGCQPGILGTLRLLFLFPKVCSGHAALRSPRTGRLAPAGFQRILASATSSFVPASLASLRVCLDCPFNVSGKPNRSVLYLFSARFILYIQFLCRSDGREGSLGCDSFIAENTSG